MGRFPGGGFQIRASAKELQTNHEEHPAASDTPQRPDEDLRLAYERLHTSNEECQKTIGELRARISALDRERTRLAHLSAIVESSEDAIVGRTLDGIITAWNRGAERLYGYTAEEAVGRNIRMLAPPDYEPDSGRFLEALARGDRADHAEAMSVGKGGRRLGVSVTLSPILDADGTLTGAAAIVRDITTLRKVQKELEEREERIRLLLESTAEAIFGLGTDGVCIFANPACARLLGSASTDKLVGSHIHALVHPTLANGSTCDETGCPIFDPLRTGLGAHSDDLFLRRVDGSVFPVECWSHPIRQGGQVVGAVVTFIDVTARKKAENEIRTAARRREQFLAMLSHELRNPLAAVLTATKLLEMVNDPAGVERARGVIERQAGHMARLLDDLLDVSRLTRGDIGLHREDLDFRSVIRAGAEAVAPLLEERDAELAVSDSGGPLPVNGDPARLQQVVGNLLSNAARYSPRGRRIRLSTGIEDGCVTLRVKDEGHGIPADMLSDIFDLFVQADQGLDRPWGGMGVGLTLVRTIVELHGGTVEAKSDGPDLGSEFVVRLPKHQGVVPHASVRERRETAHRRVVLVEDQEDTRHMLRLLLQARGHVVIEAANGALGIETITKERPNVALVDIGLPLVNGYEVARRIRKDPSLENVHLVALTGYGSFEDVEASLAAGFDEHLTKPADPDQIEEILGRLGGAA